jgi:hypothetical protein
MSEGALFRTQVGDAWFRAPENVRLRFDHDPKPGHVIRYVGRMTEVRCSAVGKLLGWMVQRTGALMPFEGDNVPVDIVVWSDSTGAVHKRRSYHFQNRRAVVFRSRMVLDPDGRLAEHVGDGLGMYVKVSADGGGLQFTDDGYFLELATMRIGLPKWLSPGRVHLVHADVSADEFDIAIDITHPLFGRLYWQRGRFRHDGVSAA